MPSIRADFILPLYTFPLRIKVYPEPAESPFMCQRAYKKQTIYDNEMLKSDTSGISPQATG